MEYVIIGTDHDLQKADCKDIGLKSLLQSIINSCPVVLVGEEVKTSERVQTFGHELVGNDKWLSIDMTAEERKDAGIYDILRSQGGPVSHPVTGDHVRGNFYHRTAEGKREHFWVDKIEKWCKKRNILVGTIVMTCGHNHIDFLAAKVTLRGHSVVKREYLPYDKESEHGIFTIIED